MRRTARCFVRTATAAKATSNPIGGWVNGMVSRRIPNFSRGVTACKRHVILTNRSCRVTRHGIELASADANGNVVAAYTYHAFGRTISQSGPLADVFRHRFSSKYFDMETGLYYYGRRFYSPVLRRWLNRDPIGEEGGNNLYCFCGNNSVLYHDVHGCAYFAYRPLDVPLIGRSLGIRGNNRHNDRDNTVFAHEQLIFEDTGAIINIGYGAHGKIVNENIAGYVHIERSGRYNDCLMRRAVDNVKPPPYSMLGWFSSTGKYNCQDYADDLRKEYDRLMMDPCARKRCGLR